MLSGRVYLDRQRYPEVAWLDLAVGLGRLGALARLKAREPGVGDLGCDMKAGGLIPGPGSERIAPQLCAESSVGTGQSIHLVRHDLK
jgi:hypothetical protein